MKKYSIIHKISLIAFLLFVTLQYCSNDKVELTDKNGKVFATKTVKKDGDKEVLQFVEYDKDCNGQFDHWILYDDAGQIKQVDVDKNSNQKKDYSVHYRMENGKAKKYKVEKYNGRGILAKVIFYVGKKVTEIDFADAEGNIFKKVYYDDNGKIKNILLINKDKDKDKDKK